MDNIITYPDGFEALPLADVIAEAVTAQKGAVAAIQVACVRVLIDAMRGETRAEALRSATDMVDSLDGARADAIVMWFKKFGFAGDAKKGFTGYLASDNERARLDAAKALIWHKAKKANNPFTEYNTIDKVRAALKKGAEEKRKGNPECQYDADLAARIEALICAHIVEQAALEA